jgi:hypothetical protein
MAPFVAEQSRSPKGEVSPTEPIEMMRPPTPTGAAQKGHAADIDGELPVELGEVVARRTWPVTNTPALSKNVEMPSARRPILPDLHPWRGLVGLEGMSADARELVDHRLAVRGGIADGDGAVVGQSLDRRCVSRQ